MGAFRDNEKDRNSNSNDKKSGSSGGFVYPDATGFENTGSSSGSSDNFEYGDDSVAGEYEVKESSVFKYGDGSVPDTIGAYYGNETRQDRYAKGSFNEGYGYETVPEVDYSEVINEQISEGFASGEAPSNEQVSEPQNVEFGSDADNGGTESRESYFSYDHESQADELDSDRSYVEPHKYDTEDDPNISYGMPFIDEEERENMTLQPVSRFNSRLTWTIAISVLAIAGIVGIGVFAVICDRQKTDANLVNSYVVPTTKEEVPTTTTIEETPEATPTPTPVPTATPTPEPTATPVPTNTPTPKPQQIYWPVTKKSTPTPTPTNTDENTGESGSGSGSGEGSGSGTGEGTGEGTGGEGSGSGSGTGEGTGEGTGGEGSGSGSGSGEGGGSGSGGSGSNGEGSGSNNQNPEPQTEYNP